MRERIVPPEPAVTGKERDLGPRLAATAASRAIFKVASADRLAAVNTRKPARILVVDDEAHVRSMIAATLERQGYDIVSRLRRTRSH